MPQCLHGRASALATGPVGWRGRCERGSSSVWCSGSRLLPASQLRGKPALPCLLCCCRGF